MKPVVIDAMQFSEWNGDAVFDWIKDYGHCGALLSHNKQILSLLTLEGVMDARPGDWVIRGVKGEFYPCKPDIFEATYGGAGGANKSWGAPDSACRAFRLC